MVRAILDGRKTMTRKVVKPQPCEEALRFNKFIHSSDCGWEARFSGDISDAVCDRKIKDDIGDILWVRETWDKQLITPDGHMCGHDVFYYKADGDIRPAGWKGGKWRPSIHMPREAARIFLRVTDVRVERLQDITAEDALSEGTWTTEIATPFSLRYAEHPNTSCNAVAAFAHFWDSISAKQGYGWDANPWTWVISFERISKEEANANA